MNIGHNDSLETPHGSGLADFSNLLDQCLEGAVIAIDELGNIQAFTEHAQSFTGLAAAEVIGQPVGILPGPLGELLKKALSSGSASRDTQILLHPGRGQPVQTRVSTSILRGPGGKPTGAFALLHNLAPIRNLEDRLRRLDRLASLGTLSASVAHEVKNALVAVKTFVDLLRSSHPDAPLAQVVNREILRIDSIVSQLLRFSGNNRAAFEALHLHEILERSLGLMKHQFEANRIRLACSFNASPDLIRGDAYQLEQAFMNLLLNALEAMSNGGDLRIVTRLAPPEDTSESTEPRVHLSVKDTGTGIPPENLERLFEPFFTTKAHGTGLGLPITRRIIQEHQGTIRAESLTGEGATFVMSFPAAAKQP